MLDKATTLALVAGLTLLPLTAAPSHAWLFRDEQPEPQPVHVYDYTRGPVWTPNGWAYVPREVHFPERRPAAVDEVRVVGPRHGPRRLPRGPEGLEDRPLK